ncbi:uncharacterized protein LOC131159819 isoform X2 [Malania oleifera]|uniref:uncharacterized protein LOC131159819 isoform X2 n=1 Tax=Malania oleifera TaxID=397392 RepID=UPI0025ADBB60|nr:uncharacterized protein LOC131159819 isoform X2 [Malania oleifera]
MENQREYSFGEEEGVFPVWDYSVGGEDVFWTAAAPLMTTEWETEVMASALCRPGVCGGGDEDSLLSEFTTMADPLWEMEVMASAQSWPVACIGGDEDGLLSELMTVYGTMGSSSSSSPCSAGQKGGRRSEDEKGKKTAITTGRGEGGGWGKLARSEGEELMACISSTVPRGKFAAAHEYRAPPAAGSSSLRRGATRNRF